MAGQNRVQMEARNRAFIERDIQPVSNRPDGVVFVSLAFLLKENK